MMLPKTHIILGFIFSSTVYFIFPDIGLFGFFTIFLSSVFIDVDHYMFYVWAKKDWSLKNAFNWFMQETIKYQKLPKEKKKQKFPMPCIFHGIEALLFLGILYYFTKLPFIGFIIIGITFHELLDFISIWHYGYNFNHIGSQINNIINYKKGNITK